MNKARHESDLARLAASLRQLDDSLAGCMKCGLCQAVCPVFGVTKLESDVARGKLALLDGLAQSLLEGDEAVRRVDDRLNRCLLCGSCEAQCPSGVPLTDIFMQARVLLTEYRGLSPVKKAVFRGLLARPGLFDALARLGRHGQKLVFRPAGAAGQTMSAPLLAPLLGTNATSLLWPPLCTLRAARTFRPVTECPLWPFFRAAWATRCFRTCPKPS